MKKLLVFLMLIAATPFSLAAEASDYLLGVGDVIRISVYDHPDLATETQIGSGGQVSFPLIGDVNVRGITASQAEKVIESKLVNGKFLREPHVNVLVSQYKSLSVSVLGEVNRPGKYALEGKTNLLEVLALAGGVNVNGGSQLVLLRNLSRNNPQRFEYQVDDLLTVGDPKKVQPTLLSGDVIYIPKAEKFYIYGEVLRPGNYRLETQMTVMQALAAGGGFSPKASRSGLVLSRKAADGTLYEVPVYMNTTLKDGDVLFVKESLF